MNRFQQVKEILDNSVGGANAVVAGPHGAFWRNQNRDQFVAFKIFGLPIVALGNGGSSNLVKALRGEAPFGQDIGTPGASIRRMPAGRDPVAVDQIAFISTWIDDGCPEEVAVIGALDAQLDGAPSGSAFVIVSDGATPIPAQLSLRTTDGSQGDVAIRLAPGSAANLQFSPASVHVSGATSEVEVVATSPSAAPNDTTIEVVQGPTVLASVALTAISRPALRFRGSFQCRLATDPDAFDHPRGENSSFGVYAVEGPDPENPDEPPLDRIVRFHDAVALRPFCDPIGVDVTAVEAQVGGTLFSSASETRSSGNPSGSGRVASSTAGTERSHRTASSPSPISGWRLARSFPAPRLPRSPVRRPTTPRDRRHHTRTESACSTPTRRRESGGLRQLGSDLGRECLVLAGLQARPARRATAGG